MDGRIVLLLRAVNLGPHNRVPMPVFRDLLTGLGARDVVTYQASGQAVADIDEPDENFVERVHKGILDQLGLDIDVFSRTPAELADIVRANPFPHLANTPKQLHRAGYRTACAQPPDSSAGSRVEAEPADPQWPRCDDD